MIRLSIDERTLDAGIEAVTAEIMEVKLPRLVAVISYEIFSRAVMRSPVDTGAYRGSWTVSINTPDESIRVKGKAAPSAQRALSLVLTSWRPGDTVVINNSIHYAVYLEYGTKHMAPRFVLTRAVDETVTWLQRSAA